MKRFVFIAVFAVSVGLSGVALAETKCMDYLPTLPECKSEADKIRGCVERKLSHDMSAILETPYNNGKQNGIVKLYRANGKLIFKYSVKDDEDGGEWWFYTNDNTLFVYLSVADKHNRLWKVTCSNGIDIPNLIPDKKIGEDMEDIVEGIDKGDDSGIRELCKVDKSKDSKEIDSSNVDSTPTLSSKDYRHLPECKSEKDKIKGCVEREYWPNGNLINELPYKDGKVNGVVRKYYENGNMEIEGQFKDGKANGIFKIYDKNQKFLFETNYKDDKPISGKCSNGKALNAEELRDYQKAINVCKNP